MKLHISSDVNTQPQKGFVLFKYNLDKIDNLDEFIDDGELEELVVDDCLTKFPISRFEEIINNWTRKLCIGGVLSIWDVDIRILCKLFLKDIASLLDFNGIVAANAACITIPELEKLLKLKGFKILEKKIHNQCQFGIKAEKLGN